MNNYLLFDNVLGEERSREIYQFALQKRELFQRSRTSPNQNYPEWRKSFVLYDRVLEPIIQLIKHEVQIRLTEAIQKFSILNFEAGNIEIQLTSHNDGEYYHWHTDNGTVDTSGRALTFVYYFHSQPKQFSGGELVIYDHDDAEEIEPRHDRLVFFSSSKKHEVKTVFCPSKRFEYSRFTINGWVRRKRVQQNDYFDAKIFSDLKNTRIGSNSFFRNTSESFDNKQTSYLSKNPVSIARQEDGERALALLDLYHNLFHKSQKCNSIDVRTEITGEEFFENYYFMNRPVLLEGFMKNSTAVQKWTPDYFANRYGSVSITLTSGRNNNPDYEINFTETIRTIRLEELVNRLRQEPESNDYYLVARNGFFDHPALAKLRNDIQPPADIINREDHTTGTAKLWFGPKGTLTPLHHDLHSILFAQVYGKKHFKLIPPFDTPLLYVRGKFYSAVDPEEVDTQRFPEFTRANVLDVMVKPGDLLFLPVGWWHWVRALDISISATFCSFNEADKNTILGCPVSNHFT